MTHGDADQAGAKRARSQKAGMRDIETVRSWNKSDWWYQMQALRVFHCKDQNRDKLRAVLAIVRAQPHRVHWRAAVKMHTLSAYKRYFLRF